MPLLQKRHVLTLARRVLTCLIMRKKAYWVPHGESQNIQGCQKIERAGKKVNRRKENVLRRE
ncbi:hypothetical protein NI420_003936 [Salmonella enterica]|nr:hypothetical protein [Salmonella enterica]EJJ4248813.1 hypothetical protein [Salmonella enterica]